MVTHRRCFAILLLLLAAVPRPARAQELAERAPPPPSPWARASLDLRGALTAHDHDVVAAGQGSRASGSAVSQLAIAGRWRVRDSWLGAGADLEVERFALTPEDAAGSGAVVTGFGATAGLLARVEGPRFLAEGQAGYALLRVPFVAAPTATATDAHGPELAARVGVALAPAADLEANARVIPAAFGGRLGGAPASLRRYALGAGARLGRIDFGLLRVSALIGYELVVLRGSARDFQLAQSQHRVGLGLRAAWPWPAPAPVVAAPVEPRGRLRGRVRAAKGGSGVPAGAPMAGVVVTTAEGATVSTDADGRFVLEGLKPALSKLAFARDGFSPAEEVVAIPARGEVTIEILLHPDGPEKAGVLLGYIRGEEGVPVSAAVTVRELGLSARADRRGRFRLEVPPGRYELSIEAPSFEAQTKTVVVGAGEQTIFNLDLQRLR